MKPQHLQKKQRKLERRKKLYNKTMQQPAEARDIFYLVG